MKYTRMKLPRRAGPAGRKLLNLNEEDRTRDQPE